MHPNQDAREGVLKRVVRLLGDGSDTEVSRVGGVERIGEFLAGAESAANFGRIVAQKVAAAGELEGV